MWFILPLWSGKESHCSKWESSFSTLRVVTRVGGTFPTGRGRLRNHSNIKNKHAEQQTENMAEQKRHPMLDGGTNESPQSDEHRSHRTRRHDFFYHAGAVFASRLIRLRRNRASVYSCQALILKQFIVAQSCLVSYVFTLQETDSWIESFYKLLVNKLVCLLTASSRVDQQQFQ